MHMWMWFGYDLGDFMFSGLEISTRWAFALTWIALFFIALLFEGSKVYLARVQREAVKKLYPYRSDERRNLLCDNAREAGNMMEATTSRNTGAGQLSRFASLRLRILVNLHQSCVFVLHNVVGYLLMLAVMIYNVHLLLAVIFGMTLGYFLFGPKLTQLQMECFGRKRVVICTPECDDTAETSTPPLLGSSSESEYLVCQTRSCIQPSHYFPAGVEGGTSCYYGAKQCAAKVSRARQLQAGPSRPSEEDSQLLRQSCCNKPEPPPQQAPEPEPCCSQEPESREESPQVSCCHAKPSASDSQEQILQ